MPVKKKVPAPFWRSERNCWFVQIGKKQHRLDPDDLSVTELKPHHVTRVMDAHDGWSPSTKNGFGRSV